MENIDNLSGEALMSGQMESMPEKPRGNSKSSNSNNIDLLMDVTLRVTVELGRTRMKLSQILELQHGSVIELDRVAGDPVDVFVNDTMVARGEVVVVDDKFGVRITEMVSVKGEKAVA